MRERIENKTEFMEKIEAVLKKYDIKKLCADEFYGHEIARQGFYVERDVSDEAYEELNSILRNPFNYLEHETIYNEETGYLCTNEIFRSNTYVRDEDYLIYDNGTWYKVGDHAENARCESTYLKSSGITMLIDSGVKSASDVKSETFADDVASLLDFISRQRCVIFCNMVSEAIKYGQVDNAKKLLEKKTDLFKTADELEMVNNMLEERGLIVCQDE